MKKIIFFGQKPIGEQCFETLIKHQNENYKVAAAVSNDRADNVWWNSCGIKEYCMSKSLPFISSTEPATKEITETIKKTEADFIISVGYNWILGREVLEMVDYHAVNLHLAKLPDYRGNFTYNHAILNGENEYGVTLHWMVEKVDRGDYVYTESFPVSGKDTAWSLYNRSIEVGKKLFYKLVQLIGEGQNEKIPHIPMCGAGNFYSRKSLDGLRLIRNPSDEKEIATKSRAFYFPPFEAAYLQIGGKKYYVIPRDTGEIQEKKQPR